MRKDHKKQRLDSPLKEVKKLSIVTASMLASLIFTLVYVELIFDWPSWVSNLLLSLIAGVSSGTFVSLLAWLFDKLTLEAIHQKSTHRGVAVVIHQSTLFMCALSMWAHRQNKQEAQRELQKYLIGESPEVAIDLCIQQIQDLRGAKISQRNMKSLTECVRNHLDFLEKTIGVYEGSFMHYGYCGYLLGQHSELQRILLTFESPLIPDRAQRGREQEGSPTTTKALVIEKALGVYLDKLEKFLKEARVGLQKEQPATQTP